MSDEIEAPFTLDDVFQHIVDSHDGRVTNVIIALKTIGRFIEKCHEEYHGYKIEVPPEYSFGNGITDYCSVTVELKNDDSLFDTCIEIYPFDEKDHSKGVVQIVTTTFDRETGKEKKVVTKAHSFNILSDATTITSQVLLLVVKEIQENNHGETSAIFATTFSDQLKQFSPSKPNTRNPKVPDFDY